MLAQYGAAANKKIESNGVKITSDEVCLTQTCPDGWASFFQREPASVRHCTSYHDVAMLICLL